MRKFSPHEAGQGIWRAAPRGGDETNLAKWLLTAKFDFRHTNIAKESEAESSANVGFASRATVETPQLRSLDETWIRL
jgi:hypothetical protein